jgi:L-ascorbate metabolism protein UlaG (beta-lactamase superfamily)
MDTTCAAIRGRKSGLATKWTRRALLGAGTSLASAAALGYFAYRQAPGFFRRAVNDMKLPILPAPKIPDPKSWPDTGVHAAWLGHSTVLMKVDGFTILTDPVFGKRAGLDFWLFTAGIKRRVEPALRVKQLPPISLVLISHAHMDHLDTPSMRQLESQGTQVIMASNTSDIIRASKYAKVTELGWDQAAQVGPARVKAFEVNHWGARMRSDTYRGYNGYTIETGSRRIVFAGDTALTANFKGLKQRRDADLAIMPIGAYNPWIRYHCTPEQAMRMANEAGAEALLPVHHQTFRLGNEPVTEPIERFVEAAGSHADRVKAREIGDEFHLT